MSETNETWIEWRPDFAPHVLGRYTRREYDETTRTFEAQKVKIDCESCGDHFETMCESGNVRAHVSRFAQQHTHVDPLASSRTEARP